MGQFEQKYGIQEEPTFEEKYGLRDPGDAAREAQEEREDQARNLGKSESLRGNPAATKEREALKAYESGEPLTDEQSERLQRIEGREFERFGRVAKQSPRAIGVGAKEQAGQMIEGGLGAWKEGKARQFEKHGPFYDPLDMDADMRPRAPEELELGRQMAANLRADASGNFQESQRAAQRAAAAMPLEATPFEKAALSGASSALIAAPTLLGSQVLTGSPIPGVAVLGAGAGSSRYAELRAKGIPEDVAARSATLLGSLEALTEFIPGETLVKKSPFGKKALSFLLTDLLGENVNTVAQMVDDYALGLRDDITKDELLQAIEETTVATVSGGGVQLGAAQLLQTVVDRANQKTSKSEADAAAARANQGANVPSAEEMVANLRASDETLKGLPDSPAGDTYVVDPDGTTRRQTETDRFRDREAADMADVRRQQGRENLGAATEERMAGAPKLPAPDYGDARTIVDEEGNARRETQTEAFHVERERERLARENLAADRRARVEVIASAEEATAVPRLPAPDTKDATVIVDEQGNSRPQTQTEAYEAEQERIRRRDLGISPTRVPADTKGAIDTPAGQPAIQGFPGERSALEAALKQKASPEQAKLLIDAGYAVKSPSGGLIVKPVGRRRLKALSEVSYEDAKRPTNGEGAGPQGPASTGAALAPADRPDDAGADRGRGAPAVTDFDPRLADEGRRNGLEFFRRDFGQVERQGRVRLDEAGNFLGRSTHVAHPLWDNRPATEGGSQISLEDANDALDRLQAGKKLKPTQERFVRYLLDEQDAQQKEADDRFAAEALAAIPDFDKQDEDSQAVTKLAQAAAQHATEEEIEAALEAQDDQEARRRLQALIDRGRAEAQTPAGEADGQTTDEELAGDAETGAGQSRAPEGSREVQAGRETAGESLPEGLTQAEVHGQPITVNTSPSDAQKEAGNYQKGHVRLFGLDLAIENPKGSKRAWKNADTGESGERVMPFDYGYVKSTESADGDAVDVYVGPNPDADTVYVVNQLRRDGSFDEHKAMLGFDSLDDAKAGYMANFPAGWKGMGTVVPMPLAEFQEWTRNGDTKAPVGETVPAQAEADSSGDETIDDVGTKIGGARKDTAESGRPRGERTTDEEDDEEEAGWRKRYIAVESMSLPKVWNLLDKRKKSRWGNKSFGPFKTEQEALDAIPLVAVSRNHDIGQETKDGKTVYYIRRKTGEYKRVRVSSQDFATREEAMEYLAKNAAAIIETKTSFGEEILPKPDKVRRRGAQRRQGNVKGEDFLKTFALRGVEFGNWNNQEERQTVMNHAFDALMDMADVLGIDPRAIGLGGELGLAFGARGHGLSGARAHYEIDYAAINLTKMSGAGSLGHEWFHALDHYLARQDTKAATTRTKNSRGDDTFEYRGDKYDLASHGFKLMGSGVRPEVRAAYEKLIKAMLEKAEKYVEDTKKADEFVGRTKAELAQQLQSLRVYLANEQRYGSKKKPATAEQLSEFDAIAERLIAGEDVATKFVIPEKPASKRGRHTLSGGRWTNESLDKLSVILKAVRNTSGFSATRGGHLDNIRGYMERYSQRLKLLSEAQASTEKTKMVPTDFRMEAKSIDQGRASDYWTTNHEMAARAFQAYLEDKIAASGNVSDFLSYGTHGAIETPWGWKRPFPAGEERAAINKAFDDFVGTLEVVEENGKVLIREDAATYGAVSDRSGKAEGPQMDLFMQKPQLPASKRLFKALTKTSMVSVGKFNTGIALVTNWQEAAHIVAPLRKSPQEKLIALVLNKVDEPLAILQHSIGSASGASVEFWALAGAIARVPGAKKVYLSHNHPGGLPSQSNADYAVTDRFAKIMDRSGIESLGMIVVAPGNRQATFYAGPEAGEVQRQITPFARPLTIDVRERRFTTVAPATSGATIQTGWTVDSIWAGIAAVKDAVKAGAPQGIIALNYRNRVADVIEMSEAEMKFLKTGVPTVGTLRVLARIESANASKALVYSNNKELNANVVNMLSTAGVDVLDTFEKHDGDWVQNNSLVFGSSGKPFFSMGGQRSGPRERVTVEGVQAAIQPIIDKFEGVRVTVVRTPYHLPKDVFNQVYDQGATDLVKGVMTQRADGEHEILLIAGNLRGNWQAREVVIHELAHYGIHKIMDPAEYAATMDRVARMFPEETKAEARKNGLDMDKEDQRRIAAEEVVAYASERLVNGETLEVKQFSMLRRVFDAVRNFLAKMFPRFAISDIQIADILTRAMNGIRRDRGPAKSPGTQPLYSREAPPFYSALLRAAQDAKTQKAAPAQWMAMLRNTAGVKTEEIEWTGLQDWLQAQDGPVTKQAVVDFIAANQIEVKEVVRGGGLDSGGITSVVDRIVVEMTARGYTPTIDYDEYIGSSIRYITDRQGREYVYDKDSNRWTSDPDESGQVHDLSGIRAKIDELEDALTNASAAMSGEQNEDGTRYIEFTTPGGRGYREMLLTLPHKPWTFAQIEKRKEISEIAQPEIDQARRELDAAQGRGFDPRSLEQSNLDRLESARQGRMDRASGPEREQYESPHWDERNVIAHIRFDERTTEDGGRVLFIQEIQSDWHQDGRKHGYMRDAANDLPVGMTLKNSGGEWWVESNDGKMVNPYRRPSREEAIGEAIQGRSTGENFAANIRRGGSGVPDAPFKTTWHDLAVKRMVRWAAEHGYERIAWATGTMNAKALGVEKAVKEIKWAMLEEPVGAATKWVDIYTTERESITLYVDGDGVVRVLDRGTDEHFKGKSLSEIIGAGVAASIAASPTGSLAGRGLRMGGEGMRGYYDKMLPQIVAKVGKKWGIKPATIMLANTEGAELTTKTEITQSAIEYMKGNLTPEELGQEIGAELTESELEMLGAGWDGYRARELKDQARAFADKIIRKHAGQKRAKVHAVDIPPEMRAAALVGQPLFSRRWSANAMARGLAIQNGQPGFDLPDYGPWSRWWNYVVYQMQNKFYDLFRTQKELLAYRNMVNLPEAEDANLGQTLYHGRAEARVKLFMEQFIENKSTPAGTLAALMKRAKAAGFEWEDVESWLYARHAKEANAHLLKINNGDPRFNSGMSDAEADAIMNSMVHPTLDEIGALVDRMTKWTRDNLVANGLESAQTVAAWEATYKHYVPLKGWRDDPDVSSMPRVGKGFDTGGNSKRRTGRTSRGDAILANVVAAAQASIVRAEKAKVGRALYEMVKATPAPNLWAVDKVEYIRFVDPRTGLVREAINPAYKLADNVIRVRINGEDFHITFNPESESMARLAAAFKNLSNENIGKFLAVMHGINRYLSTINTTLTPEFVITNALRDLQTAMVNIETSDVAGMRKKMLGNWKSAIAGIWNAERGDGQHPWAAIWKEFQLEGGKVGWLQHYDSPLVLEKELQGIIEPGGTIKMTFKGLGVALKVVEDANMSVENGIRLATYKAAIDNGVSKARAAEIAKNLTVNFNRKGNIGTAMNAWYLFYNAQAQGLAVLWNIVKHKKARRLVYLITAAGIANDIVMRMLGGLDDDREWLYDKIPEYEKESNMIIMLPPGMRFTAFGTEVQYLRIPMPYGLNAFYYAGTKIGGVVDSKLIGNKRVVKPMEDAVNVTMASFNSFVPVGGGAGSPMQAITPTILDPFVQVFENKSFAGIPLMPNTSPFDNPPPDSERYFKSATQLSRDFAQGLNEVMGGSKITPATIGGVDFSISPETIDHFWDFSLGGLGRFLSGMGSTAHDVVVNPEDLELKEIPFLRRIAGEIGDRYTQDKFYEHVAEIGYAHDEWEKALDMKRGTDDRLKQESFARDHYPVALEMINDLRSTTKAVRESRQEIKRLDERAGAMDEVKRKTRIEKERSRIHKEMNEFNRRWNEVEDSKMGERQKGRNVTGRLAPLLDGKSKRDAVASLRDAGLPATAALLWELPAEQPRAIAEWFARDAARA